MACEEMQLFYAYLDAIEEEKRKAQPWQCEVTVIPPPDEAKSKAPAPQPAPAAGQSGFVCDEPE
jgi:hypothetical protein